MTLEYRDDLCPICLKKKKGQCPIKNKQALIVLIYIGLSHQDLARPPLMATQSLQCTASWSASHLNYMKGTPRVAHCGSPDI